MTNPTTNRPFWREALEGITPLVTIGGILLFILVRLYYNRFYGALGISPNELGLGYASILASSVGFLLVGVSIVLSPTLVIGLIYATSYVTKTPKSDFPRSFRGLLEQLRPGLLHITRSALPAAIIVTLAIATVWFVHRAEHYSNEVKQGHAVKFRGVPFSSFIVRATPAEIIVIGKGSEEPGLEVLQSRSRREPPLLYLGQANAAFMFYDSEEQQAIQVPASSVVLRLNNCQTLRSPNSACKSAVG
jgi:hypothetical protein